MSRHPRPVRAAAAGVLLVLASGCTATTPSPEDPSGSPASSAADPPSATATATSPPDGPEAARTAGSWLRAQLTDGLVRNEQYDVDDVGLTLDVGLALEDVEPGSAQSITRALQRPGVLSDYLTAAGGAEYAGATAKALVFADVAGLEATDVAGTDLVSRLEGLVITDGPATGRVQDRGETDYANVIGQVYAVRALRSVGSPLADDVTAYLLGLQCSAGWFPGELPGAGAADQTCDGSPRLGPDADATALAAGSISAPPGESADQAGTDTAVQEALDWLERRQRPDGSVAGDVGSERAVPNANTTGLAGWALGRAGRIGAAGKAATWLVEHQVPADESGALAGEAGAVAYDEDALERPGGITRRSADQWRRATAQAVLALGYDPS